MKTLLDAIALQVLPSIASRHASPKHLHRYVGEFAFRLGDGDVSRHTLDRLASLFSAALGRRRTANHAMPGNLPGSSSFDAENIQMLPTLAQDVTTRATETQVLQALTSLAGLPSRQADDAEMDRHMYFVALEGVTRYALSEAVIAVVRGKLGHTFFPSPIELRQLCDKAQQPHIGQARRIRVTESTFAERRRMEMVHAGKTPEAKARVAALHAKFLASYRQEPEFVPTLDPELVAKVPDAPSTFSKAKVA